MTTWRAKVSDFFRRWRVARDEVRQAKRSRQEQRGAEELDRARAGDRFPPTGS